VSDDGEVGSEGLAIAFDLYAAAETIMRQSLRRRFPQLDDDEIERRLELWLESRPGALGGDGDGVPASWPRRAEQP
jgi:hypothetical protein